MFLLFYCKKHIGQPGLYLMVLFDQNCHCQLLSNASEEYSVEHYWGRHPYITRSVLKLLLQYTHTHTQQLWSKACDLGYVLQDNDVLNMSLSHTALRKMILILTVKD